MDSVMINIPALMPDGIPGDPLEGFDLLRTFYLLMGLFGCAAFELGRHFWKKLKRGGE